MPLYLGGTSMKRTIRSHFKFQKLVTKFSLVANVISKIELRLARHHARWSSTSGHHQLKPRRWTPTRSKTISARLSSSTAATISKKTKIVFWELNSNSEAWTRRKSFFKRFFFTQHTFCQRSDRPRHFVARGDQKWSRRSTRVKRD